MHEIKLGVRQRGFWRAQLINADTGRVDAEYSGRNLITDHGYELLATYGLRWWKDRDSNMPYTARAHVGTGTAPIDASSVTLDGHAAETTANGGIAPVITAGADGWYTVDYTRQFDAAQVDGLNLTRAGISPDAVGPTNAREMFSQWLFTDQSGNPITITPNNQHLRITWTHQFYFEPVTPQAFTSNGRTGQFVLMRGDSNGGRGQYADIGVISDLMRGGCSNCFRYDVYANSNDAALDYNTQPAFSTAGRMDQNPVVDPYVSGSRTRRLTMKWLTTQANGTIKTIRVSTDSVNGRVGLLIRFDDGQEPVKADTQEMTLALSVVW